MTEIAQTLRTLMRENKFTMQGLADKAGVPFATIKSIIQGRSENPRGHTLHALASVFGCDVNALMNGDVFLKESDKYSQIDDKIKLALFKQAIIVFDEIATKNNINFEKNQEIRDNNINKLYEFALETAENTNTSPKIDRTLAQWLASNSRM